MSTEFSTPQLVPADLSRLPAVTASEPGVHLVGYDQDNPARLVRVPTTGSGGLVPAAATAETAGIVKLGAPGGAAPLNEDGEIVGPILPRMILESDSSTVPAQGEVVLVVDSLTSPTRSTHHTGDGVTVRGVPSARPASEVGVAFVANKSNAVAGINLGGTGTVGAAGAFAGGLVVDVKAGDGGANGATGSSNGGNGGALGAAGTFPIQIAAGNGGAASANFAGGNGGAVGPLIPSSVACIRIRGGDGGAAGTGGVGGNGGGVSTNLGAIRIQGGNGGAGGAGARGGHGGATNSRAIDMKSGDGGAGGPLAGDVGGAGGIMGTINTSAGNGSNATSGVPGASGGNGGTINTSGSSASGATFGASGGNINTSANGDRAGGFISTNAGASFAGGSINLADGANVLTIRGVAGQFGHRVAVPANSAAAGLPGQWASDDSFIYAYGATGWRRIAASTF